jgi:L-fuconolactonase
MVEHDVLDAHVHLWDPKRLPMPWLESAPDLNHAFGIEAYRAQTDGVPVTRFVYVEVGVAPPFALIEATQVVALAQQAQQAQQAQMAQMAQQARREPRLVGVVAAAPLEIGDRTRSYLDALSSHPLGPLVKGVRRNVQDEPDPAFCLQPAFVRGVQMLADYGLSCDICVRHQQLAATIELVRQCPEVHFVLDHLGKPDIKGTLLDPWRVHLEQLAAYPNVWCKLSGMVTEADHQRWGIEDLRPYAAHALTVFGPQRVMFGSDWPVMLQATSYTHWVQVLDELVADLPEDSQRDVWHGSAERFYRVDEQPPHTLG